MNKDRLLRLADLLEANANNPMGAKFDLHCWGAKAGFDHFLDWSEAEQFAHGVETKAIPVDCGTVVCAVGLAAISGVFKDEGFGWAISQTGWLIPTYGDDEAFRAVNEFFELNTDQAEFLFVSENYPITGRTGRHGELMVANRIREFVSTDGANQPHRR